MLYSELVLEELNTKALEGEYEFEGYLAVFNNKDQGGDIVMPESFNKTLKKRPFNKVRGLWNHQKLEPIHKYLGLGPDSRGLEFKARLTKGVQRAEEARLLLLDDAIEGNSFGYDIAPNGSEWDEKTRTRTLKDIILYEGSIVTFPMNERALTTRIKDVAGSDNPRAALEDMLQERGLSKSEAVWMAARHRFDIPDEDSGDGAPSTLALGIKSAELFIDLRRAGYDFLTAPKAFDELDMKAAIPFRKMGQAPATSEWDGPAEVAKASVLDLFKMCAWYDRVNADTKSAYKLAHHRQSDFHAVWNGVTAAMAALNGARAKLDVPASERAGIYRHLVGHYREFDKEPPELASA